MQASGVKSFMLCLEKERGWDRKHMPPHVITSSTDGTGRKELMQRIRHILDLYDGVAELEVDETITDGSDGIRSTVQQFSAATSASHAKTETNSTEHAESGGPVVEPADFKEPEVADDTFWGDENEDDKPKDDMFW